MNRVFNITIDPTDFETGLDAIALVANPAVEVNFLTFSKEEPIKMQFADDEKHIITGVALLADTPIYRVSPSGEEYYVVFGKETIKQLVEKYFKFGLTNSVNIEHNDNQFVNDVIMLESYIVDKERGICPNEFSSVPDGSWIVSYKVENLNVWDKIKSGEVLGYSVQGLFQLVESKLEFKSNKVNSFMKLKNAIKNLLLQFGEVATDKGTLEWEGEKQLEVGDEVTLDGEAAPDGEYKVDDKIFVIKDGKVEDIKDEAVAEEPKEEPAVEEPMANEEPKEEPVAEEPAEPAADPKDEKIANLEDRVAALEGKIEELVAKIAEISTKPAAEPVMDEFEKAAKPKGDTKLDKQLALAAAFRSTRK